MVEIQKKLISINYSKGVVITPKYIVIHNTANASKGADAQAHYNYWSTNTKAYSSVHFVVDDHSIIQLLELNQRAWHVGDNNGHSDITNSNSIGIEICENADGDYNKAEENAKDLVAYLIKTLNFTIDMVKTHNMSSGKYCPHIILDRGTWGKFIEDVKNRLNPPQSTEEVFRVRKSWEDVKSQIGAYSVLQNAKDLVDKNPGYHLYNSKGENIYPVVVTPPQPKPQPQVNQKVLAYQKAFNKMGLGHITEDGILGNETLGSVSKLPLLKVGSNNPMVGWLQGVVGCGQDNVFGNITKSKVIAYQSSHGLVADGIAGQMTIKNILTH